jgi:hypothetical protein
MWLPSTQRITTTQRPEKICIDLALRNPPERKRDHSHTMCVGKADTQSVIGRPVIGLPKRESPSEVTRLRSICICEAYCGMLTGMHPTPSKGDNSGLSVVDGFLPDAGGAIHQSFAGVRIGGVCFDPQFGSYWGTKRLHCPSTTLFPQLRECSRVLWVMDRRTQIFNQMKRKTFVRIIMMPR